MKQALIVAFFGAARDRFTQTGEPIPIREKLRRAAEVPGVQGAEIIYPDECLEPSEVLEALEETGLQAAAINVNLKGRREFLHGALISPDHAIRRSALELIVEAKEFALRAGAERVTCAPLADGVDYPLQQNYTEAWKRAVETLRAATGEGPVLPLHLEHKPADPRVRGLLSSSDVVLKLLHDVGEPGIGITFNIGHASLDGCLPAASLAHVLASGAPLYIHICDAAGQWDWDVLPGSHHYWQLLECLQLLRDNGYDGWLTSDSFPIRQEPLEFAAMHIQRTARALLTVESAARSEDGMRSWRELEAWVVQNR